MATPLKRGKTRGKPGKSRDRTALREHPIYKELLYIGRKDLSLTPSALGKHEHLLCSPEVSRRVAAHPENSREDHTRGALRDAIAGLPEGKRRIVAEAALCASAEWEQVPVERRIERLAGSRLRLSADMWRYHRDEAFEAIIAYLERADIPTDDPQRAVEAFRSRAGEPFDKYALLRKNYVDFVYRALVLHYAALAVLFDDDLAPFLGRRGILESQLGTSPISPTPLEVHIFSSYIECIYSCSFAGIEDDYRSHRYSNRDCVLDLFRKLGEATPIGPSTLPQEHPPPPHIDTPEDWQRHRCLAAERAYSTHWKPWYWEHCRMARSSRESGLVPIAAASGAIAHWLGQALKLDASELEEKARQLAIKALSTHYAHIDDILPLAGSLSLRQRAIAYFDVQGSLLTYRGRKWYKEEIATV